MKNIITYLKYIRAKRFYETGNYQKAYKLFHKLLLKFPGRVDMNINAAVCLIQLNRLEEAIPFLMKALESDPDDLEATNHLALIYARLNKVEKAHELYDKLIFLNPKDFFNYHQKALLYGRKDPEKSILFYQKALQWAPNDANMFCNLALAYHWVSNRFIVDFYSTQKDGAFAFAKILTENNQKASVKSKRFLLIFKGWEITVSFNDLVDWQSFRT